MFLMFVRQSIAYFVCLFQDIKWIQDVITLTYFTYTLLLIANVASFFWQRYVIVVIKIVSGTTDYGCLKKRLDLGISPK